MIKSTWESLSKGVLPTGEELGRDNLYGLDNVQLVSLVHGLCLKLQSQGHLLLPEGRSRRAPLSVQEVDVPEYLFNCSDGRLRELIWICANALGDKLE